MILAFYYETVYLLSPQGALAQLVERNNGIVEAIGSNPIRSSLSLA